MHEATQTLCYNPVTPAYPVWEYCVHGRQRRCQEDPVSLPYGRLEKTTTLCHWPVLLVISLTKIFPNGQFYINLSSKTWSHVFLEHSVDRPCITWLSTVQQDLNQHHLTLPEAADLAQNRLLWRMMSMYGATQS